MSNYVQRTRHPITGVFENAMWYDNYLGQHQYGVYFESDGKTYRQDEVISAMDSKLKDLITRLEAAGEGSRQLDFSITVILGHVPEEHITCYTTSLDAALTLVPKERMWFLGNFDPSDMRFSATISMIDNVGCKSWQGLHLSAPIALCIAALKARNYRAD